MKKTIQDTVTRTIFACDFCGDEYSPRRTCVGCGKDVCSKCIVWLDPDPWTGESAGDYPMYVCKSCYANLHEYAERAREIQREADEKIEELDRQWREDCAE